MQERRELLESVVEHGTDLTNIVNDLLAAAKSDIGTLTVSRVPVDLRAQAAQVLEGFDLSRTGAIILHGEPLRVVGDPDRVRQIIRNLVSNAIRYGGDSIRAEVADGGSVGRVLVVDNGAPIPVRDRGRIFERYQRAHDTAGAPASLGLGLAISRQLAGLMGGELTYRHESGESIFELTLPKATA